MTGFEIVLFAVSITVSGVALLFLLQLRKSLRANEERMALQLTQGLLDSMTKSHGDLRQQISEQLQRQNLLVHENLQGQMSIFRKEVREETHLTRLETKQNFQGVEAKIEQKLLQITQTVQNRLDHNIAEGFKHFEKVQEHLKAAEKQLMQLGSVGQSVVELNNLLKLPHLRGGFGESSLERLLADFFPTGSYELQYVVVPGSLQRVDAAVRLATQWLPIDSKFPREKVLPLFESSTAADLEEARRVLGEVIKIQAKDIAEKYIRPDFGTTDMALMYLPSETLYFEVIRNSKCWEYCVKLKVYPVSPNTLAITLQSLSKSLEYYEMSKGVEQTIRQIKNAERHFEHFSKKFDEIGKELFRAQDAYQTAQTHLGRYSGSIQKLVPEAEEVTPPLLEQ